jgi:hypothetical protein
MQKLITKLHLIILCILCSTLVVTAQSVEGRWDITITKGNKNSRLGWKLTILG